MDAPRHAIDLTRRHFLREWKDLCVIGTWLYNNDQEAEEPALVIVPRYRQRGYLPACIALSSAFKYDNPRYLARAARKFNTGLGFEDSIANWNKVAEAIESHLLDLLQMPPSPTSMIIVADATIGSGFSKKSIEVVDYVPTQQQ